MSDTADRESAAPDFARLAGRISNWTTKGLLSALILVSGLAFGRQVIQWWSTEDSVPSYTPTDAARARGLGDMVLAHRVDFGQAMWSMTRQSFSGSKDQAALELRQWSERLTATADLPVRPPGNAERNFLASLSDKRPVNTSPGRWELYEWHTAFPMLAGIRARPSGSDGESEGSVLRNRARLVTWSIGVPAGKARWGLYAFQCATGREAHQQGVSTPLPPHARRILSLEVAAGGATVCFRGAGDANDWKTFYDDWYCEQGWWSPNDWQDRDGMSHRRYYDNSRIPCQSVDIQFGTLADSSLTGLMLVSPVSSQPMEENNP